MFFLNQGLELYKFSKKDFDRCFLEKVKVFLGGDVFLGVSKNWGTPKSSILIGFSLINHPFWGTIIFGNTQMEIYIYICPQKIDMSPEKGQFFKEILSI